MGCAIEYEPMKIDRRTWEQRGRDDMKARRRMRKWRRRAANATIDQLLAHLQRERNGNQKP